KLVGDSFFRFLTEEYIKKYPSISFSLNEYGSNFSNFISTVEQCKKLPYLSDIAKLELIIHKSKFGYNAKKFPYDRFAQVNAELFNKVKFYLISNSFVFTSKYPIDKIWEYNQKASDEVLE